jgi:2-phospho-L-lactate guanylyltransferase
VTGAAAAASTRWGVVVPVKRLSVAKSRLSAYGDGSRQELALAFACDVVAAAAEVAHVLVVTDDPRASAELAGLGARVVPDDPDAGLNPALAHGADLLRADDPAAGVATLSADLPALRPDDLRAALADVPAGERAFVVDRAGTGTTLLAAGPGALLDPAFGPASREAHLRSGARELVAAPSLRCDADTADDLWTALALGVGPRTRSVAQGLGLTSRQATVRSWDATSGGSAYLDDGTQLPLRADALSGSAFRFLRPGQRVRVALASGSVVKVALP